MLQGKVCSASFKRRIVTRKRRSASFKRRIVTRKRSSASFKRRIVTRKRSSTLYLIGGLLQGKQVQLHLYDC